MDSFFFLKIFSAGEWNGRAEVPEASGCDWHKMTRLQKSPARFWHLLVFSRIELPLVEAPLALDFSLGLKEKVYLRRISLIISGHLSFNISIKTGLSFVVARSQRQNCLAIL